MKFALNLCGCFGLVFGPAQFDFGPLTFYDLLTQRSRAFLHTIFHFIMCLPEGIILFLDLRQHIVEALDEHPDFVFAMFNYPDAVILIDRDRSGGLCKLYQWPGDHPL